MATLDLIRQAAQETKHQLVMQFRLERLAKGISQLESQLAPRAGSGTAPGGVGRRALELSRELGAHSPSSRYEALLNHQGCLFAPAACCERGGK
jgi:hypothetical protein